MSGILMAGCYDFFLIRWVADLLGLIMGGLYKFFDLFIDKWIIGICIIVFTIIVKMILFPMTLKQQKFSKISSVMNPELQKIQKKYQGKRDQDSMMKMQAETQALYDKYGTSPTGSCLPVLIQMPILLGLYAVIISIPTYVSPVSDIYKDMSTVIVSTMDEYSDINDLNKLLIGEDADFSKLIANNYDSSKSESENKDLIYENLITMNSAVNPLSDYNSLYDKSSEIIEKLKALEEKDFNTVLEAENKKENKSDKNIALIEKYKLYTDSDWDKLLDDLNTAKSGENGVEGYEDTISEIYEFAGIDLSKSPSQGKWYAIIIPILAFLTQWYSMKLSTKNQPKMDDNPMASSMKVMTFTMPIMSAFFCYSFAAGLGFYWVMSAVVQIIQQIIINNHFKNKDVNEMIKENVEKRRKKLEKKGINPDEKVITNAATRNVKSIKVDYDNSSAASESVTEAVADKNVKKGGIAERANMVKAFNEKNNK